MTLRLGIKSKVKDFVKDHTANKWHQDLLRSLLFLQGEGAKGLMEEGHVRVSHLLILGPWASLNNAMSQ